MNKFFKIFQYELLHFARSPFKIITLLTFFLAMIYGCQNGFDLYKKQMKEIQLIEKKNEKLPMRPTVPHFLTFIESPSAKVTLDIAPKLSQLSSINSNLYFLHNFSTYNIDITL